MKEILLKIFDSEIMYYVVIPIVIVLLGWVKNERDLKEKNKELGYWMLKCRKIPTFPDIIIKIYKMMAINLLITLVAKKMLCYWKGVVFSYIICGIWYLGINAIITFRNCKSYNSKIEFWQDGKLKRKLVITLYLIYAISLLADVSKKYSWIVEFMKMEGHKGRKGADFNAMLVKRILDKENFYRGYYNYDGIESVGEYEPLLS